MREIFDLSPDEDPNFLPIVGHDVKRAGWTEELDKEPSIESPPEGSSFLEELENLPASAEDER